MNWIELKALNKLYKEEQITLNETLSQSKEIKYLINSRGVLEQNHKTLIANDAYKMVYEREYYDKYVLYEEFLTQFDLLKPQSRFEESDINKLIDIHNSKKNGDLDELIQQIIANDETIRGVSEMFFRNEKYLDNKTSLVDALKKILGVSHFANEKDQQYIYKLECKKTKAIILCENLDFLRKPLKPREFGIELWYAGGKNVDKLNYSTTRDLPIFYSCDWDYDGLFIIYPLVKRIIPDIQLLTPNAIPKSIIETEHKSLWDSNPELSNQLFCESHRSIIKSLIEKNQWIIEESNDLISYNELASFIF